jgi:magnesium-transporting ATPase (P-type)
VLLVNATVGLVQGHQAASIVSELKNTLALKTVVRRDGILQEIVFSDLVPGDIIHLEPVRQPQHPFTYHWSDLG